MQLASSLSEKSFEPPVVSAESASFESGSSKAPPLRLVPCRRLLFLHNNF